jgi:hypothetical protein
VTRMTRSGHIRGRIGASALPVAFEAAIKESTVTYKRA